MSMFALKDLQAALYGVLTANAPLMAVLTGVYDHVPESTGFPYAVFDVAQVEPWGILHPSAHLCQFNIDVYGRKGGQKELMHIASLIRDALHDVPLTATGWSVALVDVVEADTERRTDGITRLLNLQIRVWAKEEL